MAAGLCVVVRRLAVVQLWLWSDLGDSGPGSDEVAAGVWLAVVDWERRGRCVRGAGGDGSRPEIFLPSQKVVVSSPVMAPATRTREHPRKRPDPRVNGAVEHFQARIGVAAPCVSCARAPIGARCGCQKDE